MITLYSGTPGSGKSLHLAKTILECLTEKNKNIIANFPIHEEVVEKRRRKKRRKNKNKSIPTFTYVDEITIEFLINYAKENHVLGKESQTIVIFDECQTQFNPRDYNRKDRKSWINFFTQHRKLGFDIILTTQFDRLIDRQIRSLIEYEIRHRKVNNFKMGKFLPVSAFVCVNFWYVIKEKQDVTFFTYKKELGQLYDSFKMFDFNFDVN